jgi:Family of unknown function (DUF5320)
MPAGDRTGPMGAGPRTGRAKGFCSGSDQPGFANMGGHVGHASMRGGAGRGWRHRFFDTGIPGWVFPTPEQESADLKAQAVWLKSQLETVQRRLNELTAKKEE